MAARPGARRRSAPSATPDRPGKAVESRTARRGVVGRSVGMVAGAAALAAGGVALGLEFERRLVAKRMRGRITADEPFFSLRSSGPTVTTPDGVELHVEVDEPQEPVPDDLTVVLVHGYALSLDCWHFQRQYFRDKARVVLFDLRSHGRSSRSEAELCRVPQLARDLAQVLDEVVGDGPVVLIGHSLGAMAIMQLGQQRPEWFGERVVGVGLCSTSTGDLGEHSIVKAIPGRAFARIVPPLLTALNRFPRVVEGSRRAGTDLGWVVTKQMAYGRDDVPGSYVDFMTEMLGDTPMSVIGDYYPAIGEVDEMAALEVLSRVETAVIGGRSDVITPVEHTERIIERLPGADARILDDCGHMGIIEHHEEFNEVLGAMVTRARRHLAEKADSGQQ
ncbi:alpha/beta fold hydrolase [Propionibacteriaceae bacterium Y1685]|uniref:alpha/beta fold hydrolase n=1 Tax=Microlunatus sp. Y1700 TaxID=3418487 RepID=UPI003B80F236